MSTKKKTYAFIKEYFEKHNYKLITDNYVNGKQLLDCQCPNGHLDKKTYSDFYSGKRCQICYYQRRREKQLTPISVIKDSFEKRNYKLITNEYLHGKQKLESICSRNHLYVTTWRKWNVGYGCAKCAVIDHFHGANNPSWNPDREAVKNNRKIWTAWRNNIRSGALGINKKSSEEVKNIVGYDWADLRDHLAKHPNWENCKHNFHVDHIFPVKAFLDYGINDPKIVCALDNLQPLLVEENLKKNRKYDKELFEKYLIQKKIQWNNKK